MPFPVDTLFALAATVTGLIVGSFLNVVIHRLPRMLEAQWAAQAAEFTGNPIEEKPAFNLWVPASRCPACGTPIRIRHNIPLISYLFLRGRCAHCAQPISARYPLVEALTGLLSWWVAAHFGWGWQGASALALVWTLIAAAVIDAETTLLPDTLTLPLLWAGLLLNLHGVFAPLPEAVIGAGAGYLSLWSIYWAFKLVTGREGMGYGDFKLLAALGAWMGWKMLLPIMLMSSLTGAVAGIGLILLARRGRHVPIPFGPYLAVAGFFALLYGPAIAGRFGLPL